MMKTNRLAFALIAAAAFSLSATAADAGCFRKAASGTATTKDGAQAQVFEALLQSFDWSVWAAYMTTGSTPGYRIARPNYSCAPGGLGYNCKGSTTICPTS